MSKRLPAYTAVMYHKSQPNSTTRCTKYILDTEKELLTLYGIGGNPCYQIDLTDGETVKVEMYDAANPAVGLVDSFLPANQLRIVAM